MMRTEILPQVGRISHEFVEHLLADSVVANRDLVGSMIRGDTSDPTATSEAIVSQSSPGPGPLYALALTRFDMNRWQDHVYVDRPQILTRHVFPVWKADRVALCDATDIVSNDIGVDLLADDGFAVRLEQGIVDTNAEGLGHEPGRAAGNAGLAFAASRDWVKIASEDDANHVALPADARTAILNAFRGGFTVVAPKRPVALDGGKFAGWWRIDPKSGHTLGFGDNGWATDMAERSTLYTIAERWTYGFAFDYATCLGLAELAGQLEARSEDKPRLPLGQTARRSTGNRAVMSLISAGLFATLPFLTMYIAARVGMAGGYRAGFTLWLREMRFRIPRVPDEPPRPPKPPDTPPDNPCPPGEVPGGGNPLAQSVEIPVAKPALEPPPPRVPPAAAATAEEVEEAREGVTAAYNKFRDLAQDFVRYKARLHNHPEPNKFGYDPDLPGPADYDPNVAQRMYQEAFDADYAMEEAQIRYETLYDQYKVAHNGAPPPIPKGGEACGIPPAPLPSDALTLPDSKLINGIIGAQSASKGNQ
jgi:hypothetical protein